MKVIYRFSDNGQCNPNGIAQSKTRPVFFDKRALFLQCVHEFGASNVFVIADSVTDDSFLFLKAALAERVIRTSCKSGALSFLHAVDYAIANFGDDNEIIYFVEDDYVHSPGCAAAIEDGFTITGADYVTCYDHPDKYIDRYNGGNPYVQGNGEMSKVCVGNVCHWKTTNSTTMTFACKMKTLKQDVATYRKYCDSGYPYDFQMFLELGGNEQRMLISSLPAYACHCENGVMSPLVDWAVVFASNASN
jgi:hypothetical protein